MIVGIIMNSPPKTVCVNILLYSYTSSSTFATTTNPSRVLNISLAFSKISLSETVSDLPISILCLGDAAIDDIKNPGIVLARWDGTIITLSQSYLNSKLNLC